MTRRRGILFIIAAVLIALISGTLSACAKERLTAVRPVKWTAYLDKIAGMIDESVALSDGRISLQVNGEGFAGDVPLEVYLGLQYDENDIDSCLLSAEMRAAGEEIFAVRSDNGDTYIDIAPNEITEDKKLHLENVGLFSWIDHKHRQDGKVTAFRDILYDFGLSIFRGAEVKSGGTVYAFVIDGKGWHDNIAAFLRAVEASVGAGDFKLFYGITGAADVDELASFIPECSGTVDFVLEDGKLARIETDNISIAGQEGSFTLTADIDYEPIEGLKDRFPEDDADYKTSKMGSSVVEGSIGIYSTATSDRHLAQYKYSLNVNLDIVKLLLSEGDLSVLGADNYFHFRMEHVCTNACGQYCESRIAPGRGAIIDIAFYPDAENGFGSHNLYINLNIKAMMSKEYLNKAMEENVFAGEYFLPDYMFVTVPHDRFGDDKAMQELFYSAYMRLIYAEEGEETELLPDVLDVLSEQYTVLGTVFGDFLTDWQNHEIDRLRLGVDSCIYGQSNAYNIYKYTVHVIAADLGDEFKKYAWNTNQNTGELLLDWQFDERRTTADGRFALTNIYDAGGSLMHGVDEDGNYVPMSAQELDAIEGGYITLSAENIFKNSQTGLKARILGYKGIDADYEGVQEITLRVTHPNVLDYTYFSEYFGNEYTSDFHIEVKAAVKLTQEKVLADGKSYTFDWGGDPEGRYRLAAGSGDVPEFLKGAFVIHYEDTDGRRYTKHFNAMGESDAVKVIDSILGDKYEICGAGSVRRVIFRASNKVHTEYVNIAAPDRYEWRENASELNRRVYIGSPVYMLDRFMKLYAVYEGVGGDSEVQLSLDESNYYINNIPLSDDSGNWEHTAAGTVVFLRSNTYRVEMRYKGIPERAHFMLEVRPEQSPVPTYKMDKFAPTDDGRYYFTDTESAYTFTAHLSNKTHGESDDTEKEFCFEVIKGELADGKIKYSDENAIKQGVSLSVGAGDSAETGENGAPVLYDVPDMIPSYITVRGAVTFKERGYYQLTLIMKDPYSIEVKCRWTIYVSSPSDFEAGATHKNPLN